MSGLFILVILLVILIVIGLIIYLFHFGHIDELNNRLDELTGCDATLPRNIQDALNPVKFKILRLKPDGFSHRFKISPSPVRRTILVSASKGFKATIDGEKLEGVLCESRFKQTVPGLLHPSDTESDLEIFTIDEVKPVLHLAIQEDKT